MERTDTFKQLMDQFLTGEISRQDLETLQSMVQDEDLETALDAYLEESFSRHAVEEELTQWNNAFRRKLFEKIKGNEVAPARPSVIRLRPFKWWAAAAILLLLTGGGTYRWLRHQQGRPKQAPVAVLDIMPGKQAPTLTLADGTKIALDSLKDGLVANQHGSNAVMKNGQLAYKADGKSNEQVVYNIVNTPKGTRFHVQLSDGTNVWLNAGSSIRYPTRFTGPERKVEVTGETYFEVAGNEKMPFHVGVNDRMDIAVLGTHFNVNAYTNEENIQATLLQGAVRVSTRTATAILSPGQQAIIHQPGAAETKISVRQVDGAKMITWKDGYFNLDDARLEEVMRQLERWYDIDVVYEKQVPDTKFWGRISTDLPLSKLVKNLSYLGVHARLEGRKLIIIP